MAKIKGVECVKPHGRPSCCGSDKRKVQFWCCKYDLALIDAAAKRAGMSRTSFLTVSAVTAAIGKVESTV